MRRCCLCGCHREARANHRHAVQLNQWHEAVLFSRVATINTHVPVETCDVIEAASACEDCLNAHVDALLIRAIWGEHHEKSEWVDPPPRKADEGEGRED